MIAHIKFQVHTQCLTYLPWPICLKKTPQDFWGGHSPLQSAKETTFHSSERWKNFIKDAWNDFDNTGKKHFSYLDERIQESKKLVKGRVYTIKLYPIKFANDVLAILSMSHVKSIVMKKWIFLFLKCTLPNKHNYVQNDQSRQSLKDGLKSKI